mgnify:CR=1 FL=1
MKQLFLLVLSTFLLIACSNDTTDPNAIDLQNLTQVDYQSKDGAELIIVDQKQLLELVEILQVIPWQQNVKVLMSREEDGKLTLFVLENKNMPERLYELFLWINHDGNIEIVNREKNAYSKLDIEHSSKFKQAIGMEEEN